MSNFIKALEEDDYDDYDEDDYYGEEEGGEGEQREDEEEKNQPDLKVLTLQDFRKQREQENDSLQEIKQKMSTTKFYLDIGNNIKSNLSEQQELLEQQLRRNQEIFGIGGNFLVSQVRDMLMEVFAYVPLRGLRNLSLTCKSMNQMMKDPMIWKPAALRVTGSLLLPNNSTLSSKIRRHPWLFSRDLCPLEDGRYLLPSLHSSLSNFPWKMFALLILRYEKSLRLLISEKQTVSTQKMSNEFYSMAQSLFSAGFAAVAFEVLIVCMFFTPYLNVELMTRNRCFLSTVLLDFGRKTNSEDYYDKAYSAVSAFKSNCYGRWTSYCQGQAQAMKGQAEEAISNFVRGLTFSEDFITDQTLYNSLQVVWP